MVQIIEQQGSPFGRLGKGIGQGLSEQIPKEIDRYRLSEGLQNLEKDAANLTPLQQYTRLAAIPGITPSMIQALPEILKNQSTRQAYAKKYGAGQQKEDDSKISPSLKEVPFGGERFANRPQRPSFEKQSEQQTINEEGQPLIVDKNPLRPEAQPRAPWTTEKRNEQIYRNFEEFPNLNLQENLKMVEDQEARELSQSEAERTRDEYLKKIRKDLDDEFTNQLEIKLQKTNEGVYKDVTGENISRTKRLIERDLRTKPNANIADVVNKRTDQLLDLAKTKSQLNKLANRSLADKINPLKKSDTFNKLKSYQKTFQESGNSEEFFNILKSRENGFELSPQAAASIAYPLNKNLDSYISNIKPSNVTNFSQNSRKYADEIQKYLTGNDSILSIIYNLRVKDPLFNQSEFLEQLRSDRENVALTSRIGRELDEGESDFLPNWSDIMILPFFRGL
jgi:hypothetical protein